MSRPGVAMRISSLASSCPSKLCSCAKLCWPATVPICRQSAWNKWTAHREICALRERYQRLSHLLH